MSDARSAAVDALAGAFTGPASRRIADAREVAAHLDAVLAAIESGEISATERESARIEGAILALRAISG